MRVAQKLLRLMNNKEEDLAPITTITCETVKVILNTVSREDTSQEISPQQKYRDASDDLDESHRRDPG
jgi:hypothetical protein